MAKPVEILDCIVAANPLELTQIVNGSRRREPGGIPRDKVVTIEHDGSHGRWVLFYYRLETPTEVEHREKREAARAKAAQAQKE